MPLSFVELLDDFIRKTVTEPIIIDRVGNAFDEELFEVCCGLEDLGYLVSLYSPESEAIIEYYPSIFDGKLVNLHTFDQLKLALRYGRVKLIRMEPFDNESEDSHFCISAGIMMPGRRGKCPISRIEGAEWETIEDCRKAVYDLVRINPLGFVEVADHTIEVNLIERREARLKLKEQPNIYRNLPERD